MRTSVDLSETIQLDDGLYSFVQKSGSILRLRRHSDSALIDLHVAELARLLPAVPDLAPSPRALDVLSSEQSSGTSFWALHIREVLTGVRLDTDFRNPDYDPALHRLESRVASKIADLEKVGTKVSRATMMRKIKVFRESGTVGLIDRRALRPFGPLDRLDERVMAALCDVMAAQLYKSTGTKSRIVKETFARCLKQGVAADELPSTPSMYRYIDALDRGRHTTKSAKTRRSLGERPNTTYKKNVKTLPGAEVQVDSNTLDVLVRTGNKTARPLLTVMIDVASRSILAATLRLEGTKGVDHAVLLAQALTHPLTRPGRSHHRALIGASNPTITLLSDQEREALALTAPFVHPRRVMMDNGSDYASATFMAALEKFGIDATTSAPHTPTGKSIIERLWGTINTQFCQYLPGYTGGTPENRGLAIEKEKNLLTPDALFELFDDWVLSIYQNTPHHGLRDRMDPTTLLSPNQVLAAAAQVTGTIEIPLTTEDYIDLMPSDFRNISSTGVEFNNREYDSVEIHALRGTASGNAAHHGKWEIKYDPYNPEHVWVRSRDNTWIECVDRNQELLMQPFFENVDYEPAETEREALARTQAALSGVPIHAARLLPPLPEDFPDDEDDIPVFDTFNPTQGANK